MINSRMHVKISKLANSLLKRYGRDISECCVAMKGENKKTFTMKDGKQITFKRVTSHG
jgi:hypothetical protein